MEKKIGISIFRVLKRIVTEYVEGFFSVLYFYEYTCIICRNETNNNHILCDKCKAKQQFKIERMIHGDEYSFKGRCCYYYSGKIREAVTAMKFKRKFEVINSFAADLAYRIVQEGIEFDIITYVPSEKSKLRKRGFNQSHMISKRVSEILNKGGNKRYKVLKLLEKNECNDQIGLGRNERWVNVKNVFNINPRNEKNIQNKKIILIDDVLTSGATAYYCSKELMKAGAASVEIFCIAQSNL